MEVEQTEAETRAQPIVAETQETKPEIEKSRDQWISPSTNRAETPKLSKTPKHIPWTAPLKMTEPPKMEDIGIVRKRTQPTKPHTSLRETLQSHTMPQPCRTTSGRNQSLSTPHQSVYKLKDGQKITQLRQVNRWTLNRISRHLRANSRGARECPKGNEKNETISKSATSEAPRSIWIQDGNQRRLKSVSSLVGRRDNQGQRQKIRLFWRAGRLKKPNGATSKFRSSIVQIVINSHLPASDIISSWFRSSPSSRSSILPIHLLL